MTAATAIREASTVHPVDQAAFTALDNGATPDWPTWLGSIEGAAAYLSPRGQGVFDTLRAEIPEFFGKGWLAAAVKKRTVPEARILSPVLTLSDPAEQFATLLRIWAVARLGQVRRGGIQGVDRVRRQLRTDIRSSRFLHSLTQLELAGAGLHVGTSVELEPPKAGGPGDVLLRAGDTEVFLEVVTLSTDQAFLRRERALAGHQSHVRALELQLGVSFDGDLPGVLEGPDAQTWRDRMTSAAAKCAADGQAVTIHDVHGMLTIRPDEGRPGQRLTGQLVQIDAARRLLLALERKAAQTRAAATAWLWLVDHNDVMALAPFSAAPPAEQIGQLHALVHDVLDRHPHLAGIVWTRTGRIVSPVPTVDAQQDSGYAIVRSLPGCRVRQSVVLPRRIVLPYQTQLLLRLLDREPDWLDGALERLGYPGGLAALLA